MPSNLPRPEKGRSSATPKLADFTIKHRKRDSKLFNQAYWLVNNAMPVHGAQPGQDPGNRPRGEITFKALQHMMAGGQEVAVLEGSLSGTV